jgi:hypothetical protein
MPESKSGALPLGDSPKSLIQGFVHRMTIQSFCDKPFHIIWNLFKSSLCCQRSVANSANTHAPEPLIAAIVVFSSCFSHSKHLATSGYKRQTTDSRSLCPCQTEKGGILMGIVLRVNSLLAKISAVDTCTDGTRTRYQAGGSSMAVAFRQFLQQMHFAQK